MPPRSARRRRGAKSGAVGFVGYATDATAHYFGNDEGRRHHAACADRLCRLDRARGRDVPRDLPRRAADRARRLFRPRDQRRARRRPALSRARRGRQVSPCASTRMAGAMRGARPRPAPTRCSSGTRRNRSAATAPRRSCAISSAPASRRRRSGRCASAWTRPGFAGVKIVASSGFGPAKCRMMAAAEAPIDVVGTGSYLPELWTRDLRHRRHHRL